MERNAWDRKQAEENKKAKLRNAEYDRNYEGYSDYTHKTRNSLLFFCLLKFGIVFLGLQQLRIVNVSVGLDPEKSVPQILFILTLIVLYKTFFFGSVLHNDETIRSLSRKKMRIQTKFFTTLYHSFPIGIGLVTTALAWDQVMIGWDIFTSADSWGVKPCILGFWCEAVPEPEPTFSSDSIFGLD